MGCHSSVHALPFPKPWREDAHFHSLAQTSLLTLALPTDQRTCIFACSETDSHLKPAFARKRSCEKAVGLPLGASSAAFPLRDSTSKVVGDRLGFGASCRRCSKKQQPNQDSWVMLHVEGAFTICGIFDGHGEMGHYISDFVKEHLLKLVLRGGGWSTALRQAFKDMQRVLELGQEEGASATLAGTTATVVVYDTEAKAVVAANVGDSSAVLGSQVDGLQCFELSLSHKPMEKGEKARIEKAGGAVVWDGTNHRVVMKGTPMPGLNMSRSLGDVFGHRRAGLSAEPHVQERRLQHGDRLIVLGSDGLWDFVPPKEVLELAYSYGPGGAEEAAQALAEEARARWVAAGFQDCVDDITVLVLWLDQEQGVSLI